MALNTTLRKMVSDIYHDTTGTPAAATLTFEDYMSVPSGDNFHNFLDVLNDAGVHTSIDEDDFLSSEDVEADMQMLGDNLGFWGLWMDAKLKGFDALCEEGFEGIKATADLSGRVCCKVDGKDVSADWCRRDGICYIRYGSMVQTIVASRSKTKRSRDQEDARDAKYALELMYEHSLEE